MLKQLIVHNIALIESLSLDFESGFSVITGETGAGKSILLDALGFVLGERANRDLIAVGKEKASAEAVFSIESGDPAISVLAAYDIFLENGELDLFRDLHSNGRSTCRINGIPVPAGTLKEIGDALIDIHGQHTHQQLLDTRTHIRFLDSFDPSVLSFRNDIRSIHSDLVRLHHSLEEKVLSDRECERKRDLLEYQIREIDRADLKPGEEEMLYAERRRLQNAQSIMEGLDGCSEALNGEAGAIGILSEALRCISSLAKYDDSYAECSRRLEDLYYELTSIGEDVSGFKNDFSFAPDDLDHIESRLDLIETMKRKYGSTVEEVLSFGNRIREEYDDLLHSDDKRREAAALFEKKKAEYEHLAGELSRKRRSAASDLCVQVTEELTKLGMPDAVFEASFSEANAPLGTPDGIDSVEFLFSANRGIPPKPLSRIASGGELSRIMLAFKSVFSQRYGVMTMVFDEIDAGISGRTAIEIAKMLVQISRFRQVLCITHLQQIAAFGDHHYLVEKSMLEDRTVSGARLLSDAERASEIVRIMGSDPADGTALLHADSLLFEAAQQKYNLLSSEVM